MIIPEKCYSLYHTYTHIYMYINFRKNVYLADIVGENRPPRFHHLYQLLYQNGLASSDCKIAI